MMEHTYDYKKYAILYVDDEEKSLKYFARAYDDQFRILTATSAQEGLRLLEQHKEDIGLIMSDQRMPGEKGVWLLEKARHMCPRVIRILATAFSDMDAAIAAVNTGSIYKYISKPWDPPQLESTLKRGLEFFIVQKERDQLLREKLSVLHNMMISDRIVSLGLLAAGLSHHIRNSLVAVKTFLDLAPSKLKEENLDTQQLRNPEFWREYHQKVQGQIEKVNHLLHDLWRASENVTVAFQDKVDLKSVVAENLVRCQKILSEKQIIVRNQMADGLPQIQADRHKISRLFELLLRDEQVSLPVGAEINITSEVPAPKHGVPNQVVVKIRDNGPGMPKEALRLVFDPFVLRSDSPLEYGINLMACYFIIHHHGGKIEAVSEPDQGTTFVLTFPLNPNQPLLKLDGDDFLKKVLLNDSLWEQLMSAA